MYMYRQNRDLFHARTRAHTSRFTHTLEERERERERESEETRTRPRQTDRPNFVIKKSRVKMQGGDHNDVVNPNGGGEKQAEIYTHDAPWLIYACNWSVRCCVLFYTRDCRFRSPSFWVVFSLRSYNARLESDAIPEREWICVTTKTRALFFVSLLFREKRRLTQHHSRSLALSVLLLLLSLPSSLVFDDNNNII